MTNRFVQNRIEELLRVARSLQEDSEDPESRGPARTKEVAQAIDQINAAVVTLSQSITAHPESYKIPNSKISNP